MKIQDLENQTGLERATIRFYERQGLITPQRSENGYRKYSAEDAQQLLKIKLLRQLDFPLEKIKELQQGREDVSHAMEEQLRFLEGKTAAMAKAGEICREIRNAGVSYAALDAAVYLNLLSETVQKPKFRESVMQEYHPIRRYFARQLDWSLIILLLNWLVYGVIRIRPVRDVYSYLMIAAGLLVSIFTEAVMLHFLGTTPGKWIMGIRVESVNGGKLNYEESMWRARLVTQYGMGFQIPVWREIRFYLGFKGHTDGNTLEWEEDSELHYKNWSTIRLITAGLAYLLITVSLATVMLDYTYLPKNRVSQLTVSEFVDNYNGYAREGTFMDLVIAEPTLQRDGTWGGTVIYADGTTRENPVFHCDENGFIEEVELRGKSERILEICKLFTKAVVGAQPHMNAMDMAHYNARYEVDNHLELPIQEEETKGEFQVENLQIVWTYEPFFDELTYIIRLPE